MFTIKNARTKEIFKGFVFDSRLVSFLCVCPIINGKLSHNNIGPEMEQSDRSILVIAYYMQSASF